MEIRHLLAGTLVAVLAVWAAAATDNEAELKAELIERAADAAARAASADAELAEMAAWAAARAKLEPAEVAAWVAEVREEKNWADWDNALELALLTALAALAAQKGSAEAAEAAALIDRLWHHCHIVNIRGHARPDTENARQTSLQSTRKRPKNGPKGLRGAVRVCSRLENPTARPSIRGV